MEILTFIKQSIFNPITIGAIIPSSKYAARKMVEDIDFNQAKYIVEYGPGTGIFTSEILKKRKGNTIVLSIEFNKKFYGLLKEKFENEKNFYLINGSAEDIDKYLEQYNIPYIDYIVSALPYLSLPQEVSENVLSKSTKLLKKDGKFMTIMYSKFKLNYINKFFKKIDIKREIRNVPPAHIFSCRN